MSPGNDSVEEVVHLDPTDLRPEAVEAVVVAEQFLAVFDLEGKAGGGRTRTVLANSACKSNPNFPWTE